MPTLRLAAVPGSHAAPPEGFEPTTDWIRLERRFPVTLVLQDPAPEVVLHMGSDARALIIY